MGKSISDRSPEMRRPLLCSSNKKASVAGVLEQRGRVATSWGLDFTLTVMRNYREFYIAKCHGWVCTFKMAFWLLCGEWACRGASVGLGRLVMGC